MSQKTALVLSGGGMFGAYQAGVWAALQGSIQPDIVVGTSIGALNGWLIAGGCTGAALEEHWLNLGSGSDVKWRFPRGFSEGIIDPALAEDWIQKIYKSCTPKVHYAVVTTEMRTMKRARFEWPSVTWQHLAASCAVPLFLRQQRIDGILYGDGGLDHPLSIWDAVAMGATRVVAVNVLKNRPLVVRAAAAMARLYGGYRNSPLGHVDIVDIGPAKPLGAARDTIYWSRANTERWIALGRRDADAKKHLVVECFERV
jgi:predicted acylesterase/phospholipase RssA